jgi:exosortase
VRKEAASRMGVRRAVIPTEFAAAPSALLAARRLWGSRRPSIVVASLVAAATIWSFWPTLAHLYGAWIHDPQYSHGLLVPAFSAFLLWTRRGSLPKNAEPVPLAGIILLTFGAACRIFGGFMHEDWPEAIALLPCLLGLILTFGGWPALRWAAAPVLFLAFMIPMPWRYTIWLAFPLQQVATIASTYVLQTLGQPALAEGNIIQIRDYQLSIVKACSGLSMLVTFVTFAVGVCMVVKKPFSDKLLILLSSIPIAIAANVIRIVVTGLFFLHVDNQKAMTFFHDAAGWFMMPLALAFLAVELWILKHLFVDIQPRAAFRIRSGLPGRTI